MIRRPLGRGLEALLSVEAPVPGNESIEVDVALIEPGSMQPRTRFNEGKLQGLAQSIRSNGIVQPLLVRHRGGRYELIAGERRWRAAKLAGLKKVPVLIRDFPDEKLLELALIENIQRENLDAIEEAHAYKSLLENIGLTQESLAEKVGRDRSYITNYLRLLRLPLDIQILLQDEKISTGHARTLLGVSDVVLQRQIARKIVDRGLSVRETERIIQDLVKGRSKSDQIKKSQVQDPNLRAFESKLRRRFGTQVRITSKPGTDKGQIQIDFFSLSDFERICTLLGPRST
ncbi:MAG: ParB/RepB/Spo0J family partition protein [Pyrinomonadaceae bacterium]